MNVVEITAHADELRQLRADNAALRTALSRTIADRDHWRETRDRDNQRAADLIRRLRLTLNEWENLT